MYLQWFVPFVPLNQYVGNLTYSLLKPIHQPVFLISASAQFSNLKILTSFLTFSPITNYQELSILPPTYLLTPPTPLYLC